VKTLKITMMVGAVGLAFALAVTACGGSSSSSSQTTESSSETQEGNSGSGGEINIDVGSQTLTFPAGTKPKIAMFAGSGTPYQESLRAGAESVAKAAGVELTYFDSQFEPGQQLKQLQNALQTGEFNAWIVENVGGPASCNLLTEQAPEANIVVSAQSGPLCGKELEPFAKSWSPGTLDQVGAEVSRELLSNYFETVKPLVGPEPTIAALMGPEALFISTIWLEELEKVGLEPSAEAYTNYTTPDALAKTQALLKAHPDINVIFSDSNDLTLGAIRAIEQEGKGGQIKIFDSGGNKEIVPEIEAGNVTATIPSFPRTSGEACVEEIVKAFEGEKVPRLVEALAEGSIENPLVVTAKNVKEYEPQF